MSKKNLINKEVNTSAGITIFLLAATFLIFISFFIISRNVDHIGDVHVSKKNVERIEEKNDVNVLTEQEALTIGNDLFVKVSDIFVNRGLNVEKDSNSQSVYYRRNADDSFVVSSDFDNENHEYEKIIISDVKDLLTDDMFNEFCSMFDVIKYQDDYYRMVGFGSANISYKETELNVISITEDNIVFDAVSSYYVSLEESDNPDDEFVYKNNKFELKKENNSWKVSEFFLPY